MSRNKRLIALAAVPLVLIGIASCADPGTTDPSGSASEPAEDLSSLPDIEVNADLAAQLPDTIKTDGLSIATSADTPPMTFYADDNDTLIGFDVDMSRAIAAVLDVDANIQPVGFDTIIPGLAADRYDFSLSSIGVTLERQEVVDFVSYYQGGQGFLASSSTDFGVTTFEDLCGHRVAVSKGTVQQTTLEDNATLCADAGKDPWELQVYPDLNAAVLAIGSDRSDVLYGSISIIGYTAEHSDGFRIAGVYKRATVGVALTKDSELVPIVQGAIQDLIDSGAYQEILDKWGLGDNGIPTAEINSATS